MRTRAVDRREAVITTAARLFREKGYAATTVRDIADALGVTSAALYRYVTSKDDLLDAILDHAMAVGERHLEEALAAEGPPEERLRQVIRHHVLAVLDESAATMAVFFQEIGLAGTHGRAGIDARRARYQDAIVRVFRAAAEHGVIETVDARVTAFGIMGIGNWLHRWYRPDGGLAPEAIADHFADVVLRGLLTRPSTGRPVRARPTPGPDPSPE